MIVQVSKEVNLTSFLIWKIKIWISLSNRRMASSKSLTADLMQTKDLPWDTEMYLSLII